MKKLLSLIVMLVAYSTTASAQSYAPLYGTRLELKNGSSKTTIYPNASGGTFSLTLPTSAGSDGQVLGIISGSQLGWITPAGTGVTSITGTADQVIADQSTGAVTLSLPQSIGTTSSPTFNNVTLTNASLQNHFAYINGSGLVTAFGPASPTLSTFAAALTGLLPVANGGTGLGTGDLSGQTGKAIVVNAGETGYTFASITGGTVTSVAANSPLSITGTATVNPTVNIANAAADGATKGAASFTANDFDASSGNISIDYTNGQAASGSTKGFLTAANWTTFNGKQDALSGGSANSVTKWTSASAIGTSTITDNGTTVSTTGNLSTAGDLSLTGSNKTLSFKGNGTGVSTFVAGAQGTTSYNYTLPTTTPTANQVLTATSVSAPNVTLGWSTPSGGGTTSIVKVKLADQDITNNASPQNDNTLSASLTAGTWHIRGMLIMEVTAGPNGTDARFDFAYGGTSTDFAMGYVNNGGKGAGNNNNDGPSAGLVTALAASTVVGIDANKIVSIAYEGYITVSDASTFQVRFSNGTAGSGDITTMHKGSTLVATKQ